MNNLAEAAVKSLRPTYALINLKNFEHNITLAKKLSGSDIIAIVKADAYGHGVKTTAGHASRHGVHDFGVATISEGVILRESLEDNSARIIVLGYVDPNFYSYAYDNKLQLTLFDSGYADAFHSYLKNTGRSAGVTVKIDTGMGRLGFKPSLNLYEFAERYPCFKVNHVMSHLASSDDDPEYTSHQEGIFREFISKYASLNFNTSLYNSSAIAKYKNLYNYTRPGLFLYGYVNGSANVPLKPVMSIFSKVIHVHKLAKGESVSYGRRFFAPNDCVIGVVPVGYADGYNRLLTNKGAMYVENVRCPVVGTVCMDMTMIDISAIGESAYGKVVEVLGSRINATEIASSVNTIEYEVMCGISDRIPRVYDYSDGSIK
ncbi:MAG: alanine racemase [Deferribacteraceae bacterium]|jgi:alanine racemase|nr:alanine racemase [Deferribacteraceae bacterium]